MCLLDGGILWAYQFQESKVFLLGPIVHSLPKSGNII
ncbi:hypothetical protein PIIN_11312 [Serendipita indica DSM 11827]|uniref:Uncharacterized protein n=1 Tax=Serendipita indica (strain DSM 11827) TaxID=1109443 RepID=G4U192_SERID|nr:hypothetical protein PIIN_11312 [Serendipita indica DSM 11827]